MATPPTPPITLDPHFTNLRSVAISRTGEFAATYGEDKGLYYIAIWDIFHQNERWRIELNDLAPTVVRFAADDGSAVIAGVRQPGGGRAVLRYALSGPDSPEVLYEQAAGSGMAVSRDAQLVVIREARDLTIVNLSGSSYLINLVAQDLIKRVAISPQGTLAAVARDDGIAVYNVAQWPAQDRLVGEFAFGPVLTMDCAEDKVVAVSRDDPVVTVVYGPDPGPVYSEPGIVRIAVNRAGSLVAVGALERISLVDLHSKQTLAVLPVPSPVRRLTFSLDDRTLGTAHDDNRARIWNLADFLAESGGELIERARAAQAAGAIDDAIAFFQQAVDAGSDPATLELGRALEQAGRDAEALVVLRRSVDAGDEYAIRDLGRVQEKLGRFDDAWASYEIAVRAGDLAAARDLARIAERDGRAADAASWFRRWAEDRASQLSLSSQSVLSYADALRLALGRSKVHTENLLVGLISQPGGPAQRLLSDAGLDRADVVSLLSDLLKKPVQAEVGADSAALPRAVPPISDHAGQAVDNAVLIARAAGYSRVGARHLLKGALSVRGCSVAQALADRGVRASDVPDDDGDPQSAGRRLLAGATADTVPVPGDHRVGDADKLGIAADVEMLVSVLLARDTPLPLAVGLFGDWGSGKSFFMALMYERIEELAALARQDTPEAAPYCRQVRQVRFNAWHYVDTNLWASLAATMFDKLAHADAPGKAQAALAQLSAERERAQVARQKRQDLERQVGQLEAKDSRPVVAVGSALSVAVHAVRDKPLVKDLKTAVKSGEIDENTALVVDSLADVAGAAEKASRTWRLFREELLHQRRTATLITLVVLAAAVTAIVAATDWSAGFRVLTIAGSVAIAMMPALEGAARVLYLAREAREARQLPLTRARRELAEAQAEEELASADVERSEQELADLRNRGKQLREFVRERAASPDYRDRLGVISQVRRDFEELVALMPAGQENLATEDPEVREKIPDVDRIFLYIDDLDRCPPDKVMDVLQAVHLLLAFDIFVVVVGVDSRWLDASLRQHYSRMLDEPTDYLDKIFQIPFSLRPMSTIGYRDLIAALTPAWSPPEIRPGDLIGQRALPSRTLTDGSGSGLPAPAGINPSAVTAGGTSRPAANAASADGDLDNRTFEPSGDGLSNGPGPTQARPAMPSPEALVLTDEEREFLGRLSATVRTPRAAKRLVNIYRMIRVSVPDDEFDYFSPHGGEEYQAVAVLLAVQVGLPTRVEAMFGQLMKTSVGTSLWDALAGDFDDVVGLLDGTDLIRITEVGCYQRWIPRVSRFSFRLSAVPA